MLEKKFLVDREALIAASKVLYLLYLIRNDEDKIYNSSKLKCNLLDIYMN